MSGPSGLEWSSVVLSGLQWSSVIFSGLQWSSVVFSGLQLLHCLSAATFETVDVSVIFEGLLVHA